MPSSPPRPRRPVGIVLALLAVPTLAGCGLIGHKEPAWAFDETSGLYYRPGVISQSADPVREQLPQLEGVGSVTATDPRMTDPDAWFAPPAPDDELWQAVVELESAQVAGLLEPAASDGGAGAAAPLTDDQLREKLVPTLDEAPAACPDGWVDVTAALAAPDTSNITTGGDMIALAVACPGGTQLVVELRDM
ncbi:hypothetical protein [Brachybacterium hainanense]|uniref:DUF732 domain-containing protein n=1 Tax=Brachybacterium hainanense TaxID=1541174 RepID=A0ABV6R9V6_9MICO